MVQQYYSQKICVYLEKRHLAKTQVTNKYKKTINITVKLVLGWDVVRRKQ